MLSIALPGPVLALLVGALIMVVVVGAISVCYALQHSMHGEDARLSEVFVGAAVLLAATYGVGWAALRFL